MIIQFTLQGDDMWQTNLPQISKNLAPPLNDKTQGLNIQHLFTSVWKVVTGDNYPA